MRTIRMGAMILGIMLLLNAAAPSQAAQESLKGDMEPKVTIVQAIQAALARVPGRVHELEIVKKHGKLVWEVEVITAEGRHTLVDVDSATGAVTHTEEKTLEKLAGDAARGKVIFERHCVSCHGETGNGKGPMGPLLAPPAADYTSERIRQKSDAELLHAIQEGRPGTAMRSFKQWLTILSSKWLHQRTHESRREPVPCARFG